MPHCARRITRSAVVLMATLAGPAGFAPAAAAADFERSVVQRRVVRALSAQVPDVPFGRPRCQPAPRRAARTLVFSCTIPVGPATVAAEPALLTVDGVRGATKREVVLQPRQAVLSTEALQALVAQNSSLPATVDCGSAPWQVVAVSALVTCTAKLSDGSVRTVELTTQDLSGTVTITKVS